MQPTRFSEQGLHRRLAVSIDVLLTGSHAAMQTLRIVTFRSHGRDRKRPLNDGKTPNVRVVRVAPRYGLQSWSGESAGVAKRPLVSDRPPTRNPTRSDSHRVDRCSAGVEGGVAG
jgi:hypothetical protein